MADISYRNSPRDGDLAAALAALPLAAPAHSAWPQLAAAFEQRTRRKRQARFAIAFAAAAVIALAVGLGRMQLAAQLPGPGPAIATAKADDTTSNLIARNVEMQSMLRGFDTRSVPLDGEAALASARLEDLIAMLDLELGDAGPDEAQALWSQRLVLLQELATVRQQGQAAVAQQGDGSAISPASWVVD